MTWDSSSDLSKIIGKDKTLDQILSLKANTHTHTHTYIFLKYLVEDRFGGQDIIYGW